MNGQSSLPFQTCRFHHQALVELKILDVIKRKDKDNLHNVIHMKEYFYFRNHLCISFELLGSVSFSCVWSKVFIIGPPQNGPYYVHVTKGSIAPSPTLLTTTPASNLHFPLNALSSITSFKAEF